MDDKTKSLKGSAKRDLFKWAHKNKMNGSPFYASDADLCLVMSKPRGVVAYLDYKGSGEGVTFTEGILYDEWVATKPVYIIESKDPENGPFIVMEYQFGGELIPSCKLNNWDDFIKWEAELRRNYATRKR